MSSCVDVFLDTKVVKRTALLPARPTVGHAANPGPEENRLVIHHKMQSSITKNASLITLSFNKHEEV